MSLSTVNNERTGNTALASHSRTIASRLQNNNYSYQKVITALITGKTQIITFRIINNIIII